MDDTSTARKTPFALIVPTRDAGQRWADWIRALLRQTRQPNRVLVVDSGSRDETAAQALAAGFDVYRIPAASFDHGGTRRWAAELCADLPVLVYMTQDAVLARPGSLAQLLAGLEQPDVGAVYGRQLPHEDATHIAAHARHFNYPPRSEIRSLADVPRLGLRTAFLSNVFAAYRRDALQSVGGFPARLIACEDMLTGARLLRHGWRIAYRAEALVYHSHNLSPVAECRRYFDIGAFHAEARWIRDTFGAAEGEGWRFIRSEWRYLLRFAPHRLPEAILRTAGKWGSFRLGRRASRLPIGLKRRLGGQPEYWNESGGQPADQERRSSG